MKVLIFLSLIAAVGGGLGYIVAYTINSNRRKAAKKFENIYEKKLLYDSLDELSDKLRKAQQKGNS